MSKNTWIGVGAVAVVVIIVLALFVTGIIPGLRTSSPGPSAPSYHVTFSETGLPSGTSWSVTLAGSAQSSSTTSIVFSEQNGTYAFTIGAVSGYTANPGSGNAVVSGADVSKSIAFTSGGAAAYAVTFTESGLPSGTSWSVTLAGSAQSSTTTSIAFTQANGTYAYAVGSVTGYTASPASGSVDVAGAAQSVPITFTPLPPGQYSVTFTESGLASGTSWSVTLNGATQSSTATSIAFTEANGTFTYSVGSVTGYTANPASGSVTVAGAAQSVSVAFTAIAPGQYAVTFTESGLPSGTSWSVTLAGATQSSTTSTISFTKANGTYSYTVGSVSGYAATPSSGSVTVAGSAASATILFSKSSNLGGPAYAVTWQQTGLPSTDLWEVGSAVTAKSLLIFDVRNTGPSTEFAIPDGTYFWFVSTQASGYVVTPQYGNVTVSGAPVTISVTFERTYEVNFTESGLASGAEWKVKLNGGSSSSVAPDNVGFEMPNGTYSFTASAFGYTASPATGTVTVSGAKVTKAIAFTALPAYTVTFTETGLTSGSWSVSLNGTTMSSTGSPLVFTFPNGNYPFDVSVTGSPGSFFSASPASGTVTVAGAAQAKAITITALATYTVTFKETGLPATTGWAVFLNGTYGYALAPSDVTIKVPAGKNSFYVFSAVSRYTASPAFGNVTVTTSGATVTITFTALPTYTITLTESGLPSAVWQVSVVSTRFVLSADYICSNSTSSSTTLTCSLPDGYYTWIAQTSTPDYTANPMAGSLTVSGHSASVAVTFQNTATEYLISFDAQAFGFLTGGGPPNGTSWSVTVNGQTQTTAGYALFFLVASGTKAAYTIAAPSGYVVLPSAGNLTGYADAAQSSDYLSDSVGVFLAFASTSSVAQPANANAGSPMAALTAALVAAGRDL